MGKLVAQVELHGSQHLDNLRRENAAQRFAIIAPNHIAPSNPVLRLMGWSSDLLVLIRALEGWDIQTMPMATGDFNFKIGNSRFRQCLYDIHHRSVGFFLRTLYGGAVNLHANFEESEFSATRNRGLLRRLMVQGRSNNLLIFPYGHWYKPGEQIFSVAKDLDAYNFRRKPPQAPHRQAEWRKSLKPGAFWLAQQTGNLIVPVFLHTRRKTWVVRLGKFLGVESSDSAKERRVLRREAAERYIETLALLRQKVLAQGSWEHAQ